MCPKKILLIIISILIFVLIINVLFRKEEKTKEGFYGIINPYIERGDYKVTSANQSMWDPLWEGDVAEDCYVLSNNDCMKYSNCGLCKKDGIAKCIPGDDQGPYFKEDCEGWAYTDYRDKKIFGEQHTTFSPAWNYFYSDYETYYPSPISRSSL